MFTFETNEYNDRKKLRAMEKWLDKHIGTEYERCYPVDLPTNITVFDVYPNEIDRISKIDYILERLNEVSENHWVFRSDDGEFMKGFNNSTLLEILEALEQGV